MTRYRKKPVKIEAVRWSGNPLDWNPPATQARASYPDWLYASAHMPDTKQKVEPDKDATSERPDGEVPLYIKTPEGQMRADPGDMIIRGVQGEVYPCKYDIFHKTYEPVDE